MTYRFHILLLFVSLLPATASAQLESSLWYFGESAGIDFFSGSPRARTDGFDFQWEGTATMCDRWTGRFLFHSDGDTVWNSDRKIMQNGIGLGGHLSSTQSALILPMPGDSTKFYLLSADVGEYYTGRTGNGGISWAIVDTKLDGGRGAVTLRNQWLFALADEKLAAIPHCSGRGYWVICHERNSDRFVVFLLTRRGFEGPFFQRIGANHSGTVESAIGGMKFTQQGDRLALAIFDAGVVEVFDFNRKNGRLSNPISIKVGQFAMDVCFSPDGTKLYVSGEQARFIKQYDLTRGTPAAIAGSEYLVFQSTRAWTRDHTGQIQAGPDGRLYCALKDEVELSVIAQPNAAGVACDYRHRAIPLANHFANLGLPNFVYHLYDPTLEECRPPRALFQTSDTSICAGTSIDFTDMTTDSAEAWHWSFPGGNPARLDVQRPGSVSYSTPGRYRAELIAENRHGADTFAMEIAVNPYPVLELGATRTICDGGSIELRPDAISGASTYAWSPAAGLSCVSCPSPVASPAATTTYQLVATSPEGCSVIDSVTVVVVPIPAVNAGPDQTICAGDSVQLRGRGGSSLQWSPSEGLSCTTCPEPIASPQRSITYYLTAENGGFCASVDSVTVIVNQRPVADAGEDEWICRGDPASLRANGGVAYFWSPADGLSCTECAEPVATPAFTTTYRVAVLNDKGCLASDSVTVHVDPSPRLVHIDLGADRTIAPRNEIEIPLDLLESLDSASATMLDISVTYVPSIIRFRSALLDSTLVAGWTLLPISQSSVDGTWTARLIAPPGTRLNGIGRLLRLRFVAFINVGESSQINAALQIPGGTCTAIEGRPVNIRLDSVCGLQTRLMTTSGDLYALDPPSPNPFSHTSQIRFTLGLDGPTTLEIFDEGGRSVARLVDSWLVSGAYDIVWDASSRPAGLYFCRLTSGDWSATTVLKLEK